MATLDPRSSDRSYFEAVAQKTSAPSFVDLSLRDTLPAIPIPWAIDDGHDIVTRSTVEVWTGLAKGWVSPLWRVWREGMEAWEPIVEVPELACAVVGFDPDQTLPISNIARANEEPHRDFTPAPVAAPLSEPTFSPPKPDRTGLYGVAAAVAVSLAILLSPLRGDLPGARPEVAKSGAAATLARRAAQVAAEAREVTPLEPYFPLKAGASASAEPEAPPPKKPERGQKRRRSR